MEHYDPKILAKRLLSVSDSLPFETTIRSMMGGYLGFANGQVFVWLSIGGFGIKLLPQDQTRLLVRPGTRRMQRLPSHPPSKTYITFSREDLEEDPLLIEWLTRSGRTAQPSSQRAT